jgi:hypothetical protein
MENEWKELKAEWNIRKASALSDLFDWIILVRFFIGATLNFTHRSQNGTHREGKVEG